MYLQVSRTTRWKRAAGESRGMLRATGADSAFTLVELLVVLAVIGLLLALALPAMNTLNADAKQTSAKQTVQAMLARAYYVTIAEGNMTAVRFLPAEWDLAEKGARGSAGRQRMVIYRYVGVVDPNLSNQEYFARAEGTPAMDLPDDVWAAPLEALATTRGIVSPDADSGGFVNRIYANFGADFVLNGRADAASFAYDVNRANTTCDGTSFLNADDFLLVFEPGTGLRPFLPQTYRLRGFSPAAGYEVDRDPAYTTRLYRRFGFGGLVTYSRAAFLALGRQASGVERQEFLRANGRPEMVHRFSGGLLSGPSEQR
jgi:prepilin-type N-terminal cleavage/methylation domain-containing protein